MKHACKGSSGSRGRVWGAEKHEIYAPAFGGHLFITYFYWAGGVALASPDPLLKGIHLTFATQCRRHRKSKKGVKVAP